MKYRIKEVIDRDGYSWFYPQRKWLFFWHCIDDGTWRDDIYFGTLKKAEDYIKMISTPIKTIIHEVDLCHTKNQ